MPDQAAQSPGESRSQAFVAVEGAVAEDVAGGPLMLGAYITIWVLLLAYVFRLARMQDHTQREIDRLSKVLGQSDSKSGQ
jgi:CcmD family protein